MHKSQQVWEDEVLFGYISRMVQLDLKIDWLPSSWWITIWISRVAGKVYSMTSNGWKFVLLIPYPLPTWAVFCVSDIGCFEWYKFWKLPPTCVSLFEHYLIICFDSHFTGLYVFFISSFLGTYCIWHINPLLDM